MTIKNTWSVFVFSFSVKDLPSLASAVVALIQHVCELQQMDIGIRFKLDSREKSKETLQTDSLSAFVNK